MSYIQYYNGIRYITSNNTNTNTEYYRDVFISNYRAPVSLNFHANHVVDDRRTKQPIHYSSSDVRFLSTVFPEKIHFLLLLFFLINSFIFTIRCGWLLYLRLDTLVFSPQSQKTFFFFFHFWLWQGLLKVSHCVDHKIDFPHWHSHTKVLRCKSIYTTSISHTRVQKL